MTLVDKSIRQQILEKIKEKLGAVAPPDTSAPDYVPSDADWPFAFSDVMMGPLGAEDNRKRYVAGIVPSTGVHSDLIPYIVYDLNVGIEFRATRNKGDDNPQIMAEQVLTVLQRVVLKNTTWDGLALDTHLVGDEIDLVNYSDKSINGVLFIKVQFRHARSDPRDPNPNF